MFAARVPILQRDEATRAVLISYRASLLGCNNILIGEIPLLRHNNVAARLLCFQVKSGQSIDLRHAWRLQWTAPATTRRRTRSDELSVTLKSILIGNRDSFVLFDTADFVASRSRAGLTSSWTASRASPLARPSPARSRWPCSPLRRRPRAAVCALFGAIPLDHRVSVWPDRQFLADDLVAPRPSRLVPARVVRV